MTGSLLMTFPLGSSNSLETSLSLGVQTRQTFVSLAELEQRYIAQFLQMLGNNRTQAARLLGLDRKTLYRKLKA
ncbi:MAG: helix-turn-helix domain-containing protein [Planctomycetota bacterium]|nr:helix-turn-helix domain-containing protein [Planctomycetota bacterium]